MIKASYTGHTDTPVTVTTAAELDAVLDEVAAAGPLQIAHLIAGGDIRKPDLYVGLNNDRGTLRYWSDDAGVLYSQNTGTPFPLPEWGEIIYYIERADFEYPDDSEIPVDTVRAAAHDFLATNGAQLPAGIKWAKETIPANNPPTA